MPRRENVYECVIFYRIEGGPVEFVRADNDPNEIAIFPNSEEALRYCHETLARVQAPLAYQVVELEGLDVDAKRMEVVKLIVQEMVGWFHKNYEDPVESQPVEGGEFVWLVRKCDAREELEDNFPDNHESLIDLAVEEIEKDGTTEWVSIKELEDFTK